jgi:hypothetical protein
MPKPEIELTEAEWTIIKAVWENEPCAAPAIQEKLFKRTEWTYSTVRTLMDRMVAKGLLTAEKFATSRNVRHHASAGATRWALYALNTPSMARSRRWSSAFSKPTISLCRRTRQARIRYQGEETHREKVNSTKPLKREHELTD